MKIAGIILLILQAVSIFGSITSGDFTDLVVGMFVGGVPGISRMCGFLLPGTIGIVLLIRHAIKKEKEQAAQEAPAKPIVPESPVMAAPPAPVVDPEATVPSNAGPSRTGPASIVLTVTTGPMTGRGFRCRAGSPIMMGRDPARCNLLLSGYSAISGVHCRLEVGSSGVTVTDLGSSNGTWVDNTRLTPNRPVSLHDRAELRLADQCVIGVRYE